MSNILVVGDIYSETQFFTDNIPQENEFAFASEATTTIGSKTINVARVLSKLGNHTSYCGVIGDDLEGEQVPVSFDKWQISPMLTKLQDQRTGKIAVVTPKSGKSSVILVAGANEHLSVDIIRSLEPKMANFDCIYTSTALPLSSLYLLVQTCRNFSIPIFLDIPNQQEKLEMDKLSQVDFFMPNRQEASLLLGMKIATLDEVNHAVMLLRETIKGTIIITLDKDGCVILDSDSRKPKLIKSESVEAVDETGAGDIFRAAFTSEWIISRDMGRAVEMAIKLATNSTLIKGVSASIENIVVE